MLPEQQPQAPLEARRRRARLRAVVARAGRPLVLPEALGRDSRAGAVVAQTAALERVARAAQARGAAVAAAVARDRPARAMPLAATAGTVLRGFRHGRALCSD
jgi:hypothetical protein